MQRTYAIWRYAATVRFSAPLTLEQKQEAVSALKRNEPILLNDFVVKFRECEWPDHPDGIGQQLEVDPPMCVIQQIEIGHVCDHPGPVMDAALLMLAVETVANWVHPQLHPEIDYFVVNI